MRENRTYGSEGGEAKSLPYPYRVEAMRDSSPPPEIRDAAFGGGLDAFLEVFGGAQPGLFGELVIGRGHHAVGEAGAHGGAGCEQAERRALGDFLRQLHGIGAYLIL